ncbi:phosphotransferase [Diaporthe helianthi]|uniref:Phosphotransferase n=1 Tax=Diaporthe helianthi TaxID=158607 RepID=A0A2P5HHG3_DIAHE|nr:phosphotransferase [Diaporthe helianthi]
MPPPPPSGSVSNSGGSAAPSNSSARHRNQLRDTWLDQIREQFNDRSTGLQERILNLVKKHHPGTPTGESRWYYGSYNLSIAFHFYDESAGPNITMFRVPIPGLVAFPEDKTRAEVATMLHVAEHTSIRVPRVYHWGTTADNPTGLNLPFMIVEFISHSYDMGTLLAEPELVQRPELQGNINLVKEYLFRQLAKVHIQLSQLRAPRISALEVVDGRGVPGGAPKSFLLNNQITSYHVPEPVFAPDITSGNTISTSRQWYISIADMYIAGLLYDTDLEKDDEDIRESFVARYLFRQLAKTRKLPQRPDDDGTAAEQTTESFRLWCDDFRPHNVLCNDQGDVQGVIDWEFVYFAPESYIYDPPFWLIIDRDQEAVLENYDIRSAPEESIVCEGGEIEDVADQHQDEQGQGKVHDSRTNRIDFELAKDIENNRMMFMLALQQEERASYNESTKACLNGNPHSQNHCDAVTEEVSLLSIQNKDSIPTPLYDRMTKRWEEQRNEYLWNFTYRWDREEFDAWYWDEIDREHGGKWGDYRDRLDLLPDHVRDLMEWFVHQRLAERDKWDPKRLMEAVLGQMDGTGPFVTAVDRTSSP